MAKHADQLAREKVPSRADLPTKYHPLTNLLMVIPIPSLDKIGSLYLPEKSRIVMNEGHVIEKGPLCTESISVGDCITWDQNSEYRLDIDGVKFVLVKESSVTMHIHHDELINVEDPDQLQLQQVQKGTTPKGDTVEEATKNG